MEEDIIKHWVSLHEATPFDIIIVCISIVERSDMIDVKTSRSIWMSLSTNNYRSSWIMIGYR